MAKRDFDFKVYFWSFMPLHTYTVYIVQLKEIQCECEKSNTYVCKSENPKEISKSCRLGMLCILVHI